MTSVNNICAPTNKRSVGRPKKSVGAVVLPPSSTPPPPSPQPLTLLLRANRPKSSSAPVDHPVVVVKRAYKKKESAFSAPDRGVGAKENARRAYLETVNRVEEVCSREFASDTARNLAFFWLSQRASFVV